MTPQEQAAVDAAKKGQNAASKQTDVAKKAADDKAAADKQTALNQTLADAKKKSDDEAREKAASDKKIADDKLTAAAAKKLDDEEKENSQKEEDEKTAAKKVADEKEVLEADAKKKEAEKTEAAEKKADEDKKAEEQQAEISKKVEAKRTAELLLANESALPADFIKPSVGRIVHFYPSPNDKQALKNDVEFIPAIVVRVFGHHRADIRIFPVAEEGNSYTMRWNIPHQIKAQQLAEDKGHWEWPGRA